ncbi:MAG: beta-ketoacyl-ACP synthase [Halioglobus sp.]|nr:beta-ketoacyl-ACP synthase [Halioglobus sp.]
MYFLNNLGILCTLGDNASEVRANLLARDSATPDPRDLLTERGGRRVGALHCELPALPGELAAYDCANNRLAARALEQIRDAVADVVTRYGGNRVAVVMGTSTTGIAASEAAVRQFGVNGEYPAGYDMAQATLGGLGEFVAAYLGLDGPVSTVSTACSSSAAALLSARRMLELGLADAAVVGGVDTLCGMTLQGFGALEALAAQYSAPFTAGRDGINIGEAAAVFLLTREPGGVRFAGGCASSDAHHISAPHPEGEGAFRAMSGALEEAGLAPADIAYLNAHGTGTRHNDAMESKAIFRLFGGDVPVSTTKPFTGHTLGASGALELAFCWLLLTQPEGWRLPPSLYVQERDPQLPAIHLVGDNEYCAAALDYCMSNSFAFGGSNVSVVLGRVDA